MKEITVTIGKTYAVTTASSCTVTDADGRELCTANAGEQAYFVANSGTVTLSDDSASVTLATFKQALAALGLLGGGKDKLPGGYTRVKYLDSIGSSAIIYGVDELVKNPLEVKMVFYGGGVEQIENNFCGQQSTANNPQWWFYSYMKTGHLGFRTVPSSTNEFKTVDVFLTGDTRKLVATFKNGVYTAPDGSTHEYGSIKESSVPVRMKMFGGSASNIGSKIASVYFKTGEKVHNYVAALDNTGAPCMFDTVSKQAFKNAGSGQFIVGVKNAAQLRTVLRKLPDLTGQDIGTLTLSIPAEANTPEMQELLDFTEAQKNWELTIQERAAEVATYSLRRVRKVVWVRRELSEYGGYVAADGSRWVLEWCSAIYSPRGNDPALHGYEPFGSVEEAAETWRLVPYVDPNVEDLLTETEPETKTEP